ncbi:hypothetical protein PG994_009720 [Apiospora phragmitis]|uniref:Uncharacterized protein n=1 Tax=Apiospora phragmitis TaxID=2905665 RepID=A0ABR1U6Z0_9PEZI
MADVRLRPKAQETLEKYQHAAANGNERGDRPSAVFQPTDMSNWAQIRALWEAALETYGRVNIVVNGAGRPRDDSDAAVGQYKTLAINTAGPIRLAQIAIAYWLEHREVEGNLLWFASLAGYLRGMLTPLYFASKAAIVSVAKSLGGLRESCGIRNSCICPGTTHSPMIDEDQKHVVIRPDDIGMTPQECAEIALRLLREPQPAIRTREVPLEALYPVLDGSDIDSFLAEPENKFRRKLQQNGMHDLLE